MSVLNLIRPELLTINGYIPSRNIASNRLHANELPWSPMTYADLTLNQYPDVKLQQQLILKLADYYQVNSNELVITRGSDEGIDLLMRLCMSPGKDKMLQCPPTFSIYEFYAQLQQAEIINCPLDSTDNFKLSLTKLFEAWQPECKLIMLCNPNNPTGNLLVDLPTISAICTQFSNKSLVVIDEAYIEFSQTQSATQLIKQFDNLVVLRTLSKAFGLAGLRLGSLIAGEKLISALKRIIAPFPLSNAVLSLALQALNDMNWFGQHIQQIIEQRNKLLAVLPKFPWIEKAYPSKANFILIQSEYAPELQDWLLKNDINVRQFKDCSILQNVLRITVGSPHQNEKLLTALAGFNC